MSRKSFRRIPILFVAAATLGISSLPARSQTAAPSGLQKANPIVCSGNDRVVLRGRSIETPGNGVVLQGNCTVEIVDSHIAAGAVAVLAQGNGRAVVAGSYVEGGSAALVAQGNSRIRYRESTLRGATRTAGQGDVTGDDGAVHTGGSGAGDVAGILDQVRIGAGGIRIGDDQSAVSIGAGGVVVDDGTDTVSVWPGPDGVRVEAGDVAMVVDGDVTVDGDLLRLSVGGSVEIAGDWRDAGPSSYGAADTDRLLIELGAREESGQLHLGLAGDVLFDVDSSAIRPAGAAELRKLAHVLRQRAAGEVRLVGHTDSLGTDEHNLELSQARAAAVMSWLNREAGIPAQLMVGQGMGSTQPIAYNTQPDGSDNPAGRARNRRVEILFASRP
jgi:outer membrane protein OmpA-like peptidoglycan-associated protein